MIHAYSGILTIKSNVLLIHTAPWMNPIHTDGKKPISKYYTLSDSIYMKFLKIFYLFIHERQRERGKETGRDRSRGRSRLHAGSPMWDLIPGPQDHALSQRQMLNH